MARIRSVHPGIWTDEAFMSLSMQGRLLFIGLWTEAFDDGVFEWRPLTLKARIFPVDTVDIGATLAELVSVGFIARLDNHPKRPGAIRNFQKFQRPKKPNTSGMLTDEFKEFVGVSVSVPNQFPTDTEKPSQMEDGGWRMEEEEETALSSAVSSAPPLESDLDDLQSKLLDAVGEEKIQGHGALVVGPILEMISAGVSLDLDILPVLRAKAAKMTRPAGSWAYFVQPIRDAYERRVTAAKGLSPPPKLSESDEDWQRRLRFARRDRVWSTAELGPMPGVLGCKVPGHLLEPGDGVDWNELRSEAA